MPLKLQESHVGMAAGEIAKMPRLRGLDLRAIQLSSARSLLQKLATSPQLVELLLPEYVSWTSHEIWDLIKQQLHLRSLTCTKPTGIHRSTAGRGRLSKLHHLHAIDADGEELLGLSADNLQSIHLEQPSRLPRLFGL